MKREVERETDDRGQKELIKCCRLEMLSCRWKLINPNIFLKRKRSDRSHILCEDKVKTVCCSLEMYLLASALSEEPKA